MDSLWDDGLEEWEADDLDGEDELGDDGVELAGAHHMMILVDCSPSCFATQLPDPEFPDQETVDAVTWSMVAILQAVVAKLRTVTTQKIGKRDGIGVTLYNTKLRKPMEFENADEKPKAKTEGEDDEDGDDEDDTLPFGYTGPTSSTAHELLPLEQPGVSAAKRLTSTQEDTFTGECELDLKEQFCATEEIESASPSLQLALDGAVQAFSNATCVKQRPGKKDVPDKKQIWILTSQAKPIEEEDLQRVLKESASNARDNGIEILVWPVVKDPQTFDADAFYGEVLGANAPCEDENSPAEFVSTVEILSKRSRRAFTLPILFPNWAETSDKPNMTWDFYTLVRQGEKPSKIPVHQVTGRGLAKIVQHVTKHTGQVLGEARHFGSKDKDDAWKVRETKYMEFAGAKVPISEEDKLSIKKQGSANPDPSLILLGFKDSDVPFYHTMRSSYFCHPNNVDVVGSESAFVHLHASMLRKKVIGIGEFLPPRSRVSRLVTIKAIPNQMDEAGDLVRPAGMLITYLPFEEEVRAIALDKASEAMETAGADIASSSLVDAAFELVQKATLKDAELSQDFENAYIGRLWDYVQHVALDEGINADRKYDTEVDREATVKALGDRIEAYLSLLPEDVKPEPKAKKRKVMDSSEVDWKQAFLDNELSQFRVVDLKTKLQSMGESGTGKKDVLVERLSRVLAAEVEGAGGDPAEKVKMEE